MKESNILLRAMRLFDIFSPKILVNFRIRIFRLAGSLFLSQVVSADKILDFSENNKHIFFGYYDVTPFDDSDELLLAMQAPLINRAPKENDYVEIGYYHINELSRGFVPLGKTNTWCWQQGCRLQWYGGGKNQIIHNCLVDGGYGSMITEISSGTIIKKINKSLYSISKDGEWGLSLDFSRLQRLRPGYGYETLPDKSLGELAPDCNGIELVNLKTNESRQLFSLKEISKIESHNSMDGAEHYFNHLMFNPSGNKFLFFHLWMDKNKKRYSRLFVADKDGENIKLLNNSGSVSHYNWISEDEIILYSLIAERKEYAYTIFDSRNSEIKYFGKNIPTTDGHPTLLKNNKIIITDTYPDLFSQRNLLAYKTKEDETKILARFDSPKNFSGELRCDLHPRVSHDQKMICVDRIIGGKRNISIVPFDDELL
ncbi:MAG: hypothetical protein WC678_02765 [Parcubacteria group bacterium]|jgi:hypothetical protein